MKLSQVAVQLYTLREHCRTSADFAASIKRVRAIGYTAVQISGVGPIPEDEIVRICHGEGVAICATHENGKVIIEETQKVIDRLGRLGTIYTAYPFPHTPLKTMGEVEAFAGQLDAAGAKLRRAGQVLTYHNHDMEFLKVGGRTVLDWIYDLTAPANIQGEPDTYWVQKGGGDPVRWCERLTGRLPLLHLKDYGFIHDAEGKAKSGTMMEIGNGTLDWKRIIAAAESSGCQWFIVEQDVCPGDPFESLRQSFAYIKANLVA